MAASLVSERALVARINRKLEGECQSLRKTRPGTQANQELGRYYVLDMYRNQPTGPHITSLDQFGRELGALKDCEALQENSL